MIQERKYLVTLLKEAGIKTPIYTSMKKLKTSNVSHIGAVLIGSESLTRSSSKRKYRDQEGQGKRRYKLFDREPTFKVIIADASDERCDEIVTAFLKGIASGIEVDGNWVNITVGDLDWVDEADSILKAKMGVQFDVTFEGGIYTDKDTRAVDAVVKVKED